MQKHLYEHFHLHGDTNFLDVTVSLIEKTDPRNPTEREDYWIYTLKLKRLWVLLWKMVSRLATKFSICL